MALQLTEFQGLASIFIQDRHGRKLWRDWGVPQVKQIVGVLALRSILVSDTEGQVSLRRTRSVGYWLACRMLGWLQDLGPRPRCDGLG